MHPEAQKTGMSLANDGNKTPVLCRARWSDPADRGVDRRDGKVTRTEYYDGGNLVRAEEDNDETEARQVETYQVAGSPPWRSIPSTAGTPDRRLIYDADGIGPARSRCRRRWTLRCGEYDTLRGPTGNIDSRFSNVPFDSSLRTVNYG